MLLIKDYFQWDVVNWSKAIKYWDNYIKNPETLECLEIGGNVGGLSLYLAQKGAKVICSDLFNPQSVAQPLHKKYNINSISYESLDVNHIPYENKFDIIISKSVLGATGNNFTDIKTNAIAQIHKALKPNGKFLFVENLESSIFHTFFRKHFIPWYHQWYYFKYSEINLLFSSFNKIQTKTSGFLGTFGRNEFQRKVLGNLDTIFFERVIPTKYQYIVFGIAEK